MDRFLIYIVEDDEWYGELLAYHLSLNPEYEVVRFTSATECLKNMYKKPSVITLDYSMPGMNGDELYRKIRDYNQDIPVVVISGQNDVSTAVKLLKEGVYDYIVKNENTKERIWTVIRNIRNKLEMNEELNTLREEVQQKYSFDKSLKGNSPAMQSVFKLMEKAVHTNISVTITGETGTGKELVAKAVHYNSSRAKNNFVAVNLAAIPNELLESELFGYEKGAFTGAVTRKIGKFEYANHGTIFLDEISEMDFNLQAKLLRVLQEKELTRIGSNTLVKLDVKVITATNKNLEEEVRNGKFREDLYYRLLGLYIDLPPLRQRSNDILILAKHFVQEFCIENKIEVLQLSEKAKNKLLDYNFPGNVRELKAVIELACVMANESEILAEDITFKSPVAPADFFDKEYTLREYTNRIVQHYLKKYENNVLLVADKLDIGKSTIYRMLKNNDVELV